MGCLINDCQWPTWCGAKLKSDICHADFRWTVHPRVVTGNPHDLLLSVITTSPPLGTFFYWILLYRGAGLVHVSRIRRLAKNEDSNREDMATQTLITKATGNDR